MGKLGIIFIIGLLAIGIYVEVFVKGKGLIFPKVDVPSITQTLIFWIPYLTILAINIILVFIIANKENKIGSFFKAYQSNVIKEIIAESTKLKDDAVNTVKSEIEPLQNVIDDGNKTIAELKTIDNRVMNKVNHRLDNYDSKIKVVYKDFDDKIKETTDSIDKTIDAEIEYSGVKQFANKIDGINQDLKTIIDYMDTIPQHHEELNKMLIGSLRLILDKIGLSKRQRMELVDEIDQLGMELTRTKGQPYKDKLARLNELKQRLKELQN